ncbi:STAS domain-containing protein [Streptosporangium carneum]|uniref:Anti-sigma factor antagonist n=1 Tax=Streptosporangium carneum TaxID=47481 RepID=A0A9W6HX75_9ACTN|nr:STAS domain-containing protein [Streptosporangium carneum]GLK07040.1 anti-sigma factor antagonist [Streptosporangium carneum]
MTAVVHVTAVPDDTLEQVSVLALSGELDYTNAERFRHDLHEAVGPEPRDLVIDLTDLSFCDSTGIQVFLAVRKLVHDRGCGIALANPHHRLERLFHLTGLTQAFGIRPTVAEAVESLRSRRSPLQ